MDFYYSSKTQQNNTEYYNMEQSEYRRLTNHIITFLTTLLERGVVDGEREGYKNLSLRLEILTTDRYHNKSTLHKEPVSMLDALCGIIAKINRRKNNDLTTRQIDMFNRIVRDFSSTACGDADALTGETVNMISTKDEKHTDNKWGNGLFEVSR